MLTHLLISLLGAGIFLRIVGKEKNRRYRHLLRRVQDIKQQQEETRKKLLETPVVNQTDDSSEPQTFDPIGQAA